MTLREQALHSALAGRKLHGTPPQRLSTFLRTARRLGVPFEAAWTIALDDDRLANDDWHAVWQATRSAWEAAYDHAAHPALDRIARCAPAS